MDKKLISEDIQNMKYLFGYKPGRVISEQEQPEIDEYYYFPADDEETDDNEFDTDLEIDDTMNSEDDEFEDLEDFGDFGVEDDKFEWLPDEDNDHRDEMV
jgi:hypothetical protein